MFRSLSSIITNFGLLVVISSIVTGSTSLYENTCDSKKVCNHVTPKVANKVPVTELCSRNLIEWEGFVFRNDEDIVTFCNEHGTVGNNVTEKTIPSKILVYKDFVFLTFPRSIGVFCTLGFFRLSDISKDKICPKVNCYPNIATNTLALPTACPLSTSYLTNAVDIKVECGVLYVLDNGCYLNTNVYDPIFMQMPQICMYDLSDTDGDQLQSCASFPDEYFDINNLSGYSSIIVNKVEGCDNTFVYIFNTMGAFVVVYSVKTGEFWKINAVVFGPEPDYCLFETVLPDYKCEKYVVLSGTPGIIDGPNVLFTQRCGRCLYTVAQKDLNKKANENLPEFDYKINKVGCVNSQLNSIVAYKDVVFGAQEQNHAIVCYNKKDQVTEDDVQFLIQDRTKYPFISNVYLNADKPGCKQVFFLSTNEPDIRVNGFNQYRKNLGIFHFDVEEALQLYPECKGYYKDIIKVAPPPLPLIPHPIYHRPIQRHVPSCHKKVEYSPPMPPRSDFQRYSPIHQQLPQNSYQYLTNYNEKQK